MSTLFEKIWAGDIAEPQLLRSEQHGIMVVLDAFPATRGHAMVVPAEPVESWLDLSDKRQLQIAHVAHKFGKHMLAALSPQPGRITQAVIGYGVPHVHYQLIPSYERADTANLHHEARLAAKIDPAERDLIAVELAAPAALLEEIDITLSAIARHLS